MGRKRAPAVRLCVTCGRLKSANQFAPSRRKCVVCQSTGSGRGRRARTQHDPHASIHARARDQALRRLGREHLDAYRAYYQAERRAISSTVPADLARKRAVSRALRALEGQHRPRYGELYQQELRRARSRRHLRRPGRPDGTRARLTIRAEPVSTWQPDGAGGGQSRQGEEGARQRANLEAVRERAAELFAEGRSAATVAEELGVARWTATQWRARWQSGGAAALRNRPLGRPPTVPDSQLPAIEQALLKGAKAHGFASDTWTAARASVVIQRITGVQAGSKAVQRLLRERLGWRFQPARADATVVTATQPLPAPASATDSLAAVAAAALAGSEDLPAGRPDLARSNPPTSPAERREAVAQAWRDEPGVTDSVLAERFGVSRQTIQHDAQALQERGIQRPTANRRRRSHRTRAQYAAVHWRFLAWLADELGRPPTREDLSGDVLARWIAQRATGGGPGGRGLSPASLRQECSALRHLARHAGRPELAAGLHAPWQDAPPPQTISPAQYAQLLAVPDAGTPAGVRDRAILQLLGDVGLRPGEVCALRLGDILWSADGRTPVRLRVAWGDGRVVRLTQQATAALVAWLARHPGYQPEGSRSRLPTAGPLFVALGQPKTAGQAITEDRLLRQVLRHAQRAGIPAHLRSTFVLRHFWATQQVARGITPAELQARGGWRDRQNVQAYFQRPHAAAALAAALDLDRAPLPTR
jgi:integrase